MRMRKDLIPLQLEEHEMVANYLLSFLNGYDEAVVLLKKGFAQNSQVLKKLEAMYELGSFLKYSLQQGADLHKSRLDYPEGYVESRDTKDRWSKVYLGER